MAARKNTLTSKLAEARYLIQCAIDRKKQPPSEVSGVLPSPTDTEAASLRTLTKRLKDDLASTPVETGTYGFSYDPHSKEALLKQWDSFRETLDAKYRESIVRESSKPKESTNDEIRRDLGRMGAIVPMPFGSTLILTYPINKFPPEEDRVKGIWEGVGTVE